MPVSFTLATLVVLAPLQTITYHTALKGTSSFLDILFLIPGIFLQKNAVDINGGEYPACAAMTTGYVFRVENQATVGYLQRVGRTGHLVTVNVASNEFSDELAHRKTLFSKDTLAHALYFFSIALTVIVIVILVMIHDRWSLAVVATLIVARLCNVIVIKRRSQMGWKGAPEPGVRGDLLILVSQDRWVRMKGFVDDLKAVTSGHWLREETAVESFFVNLGTLLVFASAALGQNATTLGSLLVVGLLLISVALLGLCNSLTESQKMFGHILQMEGPPKRYGRRLDLADELIKDTGREDWAVTLGMVKTSKGQPVTL